VIVSEQLLSLGNSRQSIIFLVDVCIVRAFRSVIVV
jgi:hypothetical protein